MRRYTAACYEVHVWELLHDFAVEFDGRSLEHPVARDIGTEHLCHSHVNVAAEEGDEFLGAVLLPTIDTDTTIAHVCSEYHAVAAVTFQPCGEEGGLLHGNAADGDHGCTCCKSLLDVVVCLDASAEINHEICGCSDFSQRLHIDNVLRLRAVEVNDVQPLCSQRFELASDLSHTVAIDCLVCIVALCESHAVSVNDVDGRYQLHIKFLNIASPTLPLFSGWNCVAKKLSLCSAEE